jgi:ribosome-interacting GTPase 1
MSDRQYVIIDAEDVPSVNFNKVVETSADTLRYNISGDKTFVKYEGETPSFLVGKPSFSHSEILEILSNENWTTPLEEA